MEKHNRNDEKRGRGRPKKMTLSPATTQAKAAVAIENNSVHPLKKDAPVENYFILCNGQPVKNVKELADLMEGLEDSIFSHHVQPGKNDFAVWVENIFKDVELAKKIAEVKDKKNLQLVVYKHITHKLW